MDDRATQQFAVSRDAGSRSLRGRSCMLESLALVKSLLPTDGVSMHTSTGVVCPVRNRAAAIYMHKLDCAGSPRSSLEKNAIKYRIVIHVAQTSDAVRLTVFKKDLNVQCF